MHKIFLLLFLLNTQITTAQINLQQFHIIDKIDIQGNKKTKNYIILRELIFNVGDTIPLKEIAAIIDRSRKNLINTALFNEATFSIFPIVTNPNNIVININVEERFYFIPEPIFDLYDRNYKVWKNVYNADLDRIKYGLKLPFKNFTGRRDQLSLNLINGFSKELRLNYTQPFVDKNLRHGFGASIGVFKRVGVTYIDSLNAGLPRKICNGDSCNPNYLLFNSKDFLSNVNYQYRRGIYDRHVLSLTYIQTKVSDSVIKSNSNYFYNNKNRASYVDFAYNYSYNKVDYFAYPLVGNYFNIQFKNRFATNGLQQQLFYANFTKFYKLSKAWYFNVELNTSIRNFRQPKSFYSLRTSDLQIGNIRGLEQYLILPKSDFSIKNNLHLKLLKTSFKLPVFIRNHTIIPLQLYARFFTDVAYVHLPNPNHSILHNKILHTYGFAVDCITLYDRVVRLEFRHNPYFPEANNIAATFGFYLK